MRRILLIVAMLLIATPAFATDVVINAVDKGNNIVEVNYVVTNGPPEVRAFAFNITLTNGVTFTDINNYKVGAGDVNGYGIFPGKFRDVINASNPLWSDPAYDPIAPAGDRDALGGLGTGGITVEMGSLYVTTPPATSGKLFDVTLNPGSAINTTVGLAVNTTRGGVVLEDGTTVTPTLNGTVIVYLSQPPTPAIRYASYDPDCNVPIWWTSGSTATGYVCERASKANSTWTVIKSGVPADFNCTVTDCNWGDLKLVPDTNYRWRVKASNAAGESAYGTLPYDCNVILSTCYRDGNTADSNWAQWRNLGRPDCWCRAKAANSGPRGAGYQCDGDTAGDDSGPTNYYRVFTTDLSVLQANWKKTRAMITSDPNTTGGGTLRKMAACADIDHRDTGPTNYYRVFTADLAVLQANWKKHNSSWTADPNKLPGDCPRK